MKITVLGSGTSQGVPVIACECDVCTSKDVKDKRLRSSIHIESETTSIVIDSGPDFRQQMLTNEVKRLNAVVFTHEHKDHLAGMDDIRAFNFKQKKDMEVYASERVQEALRREFHYVFAKEKYPGVPSVNLNTIDTKDFQIGDIRLTPIDVWHHKLPVKAFRIKDFAYITDANKIDVQSFDKLRGVKTLLINALRKEKHLSHFTLDEAIEVSKKIGAETTYLTHISHLMGKHEDVSKELPANVQIAYDGLQVVV